jgi:hypothetical protein
MTHRNRLQGLPAQHSISDEKLSQYSLTDPTLAEKLMRVISPFRFSKKFAEVPKSASLI